MRGQVDVRLGRQGVLSLVRGACHAHEVWISGEVLAGCRVD